jgi:DNA replication and repair protein RecF
MHVIAAKAAAFGEALKPEFKKYIKQIILNAKALSAELENQGVNIVSGGTDSHVILCDLRPIKLTGKISEESLDRAGITCNKNAIPFDEEKPFITSGLRIGTPAITTRGMKEEEMKIVASGRSRVQLNRQIVKRFKDLSDTVSIVVFSPDDLELIKGSPGIRRNFIDEVLLSCDKKFRVVKANFDRVIKQRNNLLKQCRGRLSKELEESLSIWNSQFIELSEVIGRNRTQLVRDIEPLVNTFYSQVAGKEEQVNFRYETTWMDKGLDQALHEIQHEEVRRGTTLVGPHRDDVIIDLNNLVSRTHSSQGEQRSLALALRLSEHAYMGQKIDDSPLILLDDVFSELDEGRSKRLVECLPSAQIVLTSATGTIPVGIHPGKKLKVLNGHISLGEDE